MGIGVDLEGHRDVLGVWVGADGRGESAKYWMSVFIEIKNCGVQDIFFIVCDGLKGFLGSTNEAFSLATTHNVLHPFALGHVRLCIEKYWNRIAREFKPSYTAPLAAGVWTAFEEFDAVWAPKYPAISVLWRSAWEQFTPFLDYDIEIPKVLCSTNVIGSLNARFRRAVRARGHFPSE